MSGLQDGCSSCPYLNLARFTYQTLDTCEGMLSRSSSCILFLMNLSRLWIVSQYTSKKMVSLRQRNYTIVDIGRSLLFTVNNTLPADVAGKWGLHDAESDVEVRSPYSIPFTGQRVASKTNKRELSHNTISREQLSSLFQCLHLPSSPIFAV